MPDPLRIDQLPPAAPLTGAEAFPAVQSGMAKQGLLSQILAYITANATTQVSPFTSIPYNPSVTIDFSAGPNFTLVLTGNVTLSSANLSNGRQAFVVIAADAIPRTITVPAAWTPFVGLAQPSSTAHALNLPAATRGVLTLKATGTTDAGVIAEFTVQTGTLSPSAFAAVLDGNGTAAFQLFADLGSSQGVLAAEPPVAVNAINGRSAFALPGTTSYPLTTPTIGGGPFSLLFVAKFADSPSLSALLGSNYQAYIAYSNTSGGQLHYVTTPQSQEAFFQPLPNSQTQYALYALYSDGVNPAIAYFNGTPFPAPNITTAGFAFTRFGGFDGQFYLNASVPFLRVGNTTAANRKALETAIRRYYALDPDPRVICDGNSLTNGYEASDAAHSYPSVLGGLLPQIQLFNLGVNGQTTAQMSADAATQIDDQLIDPARITNVVVAWEVTNSIANAGETADQAYADFVAYCLARRAAGAKVLALTPIARGGGGSGSALNVALATVRTRMVANWLTFADGIVDLGGMSQFADSTNTTYYNADLIHLTDTGYALVAQQVAAALPTLIAP